VTKVDELGQSWNGLYSEPRARVRLRSAYRQKAESRVLKAGDFWTVSSGDGGKTASVRRERSKKEFRRSVFNTVPPSSCHKEVAGVGYEILSFVRTHEFNVVIKSSSFTPNGRGRPL